MKSYNMEVSKKIDGAYVSQGKVEVSYPLLSELGFAVEPEKFDDDGFPVYKDEKAQYVFDAVLAAVKAAGLVETLQSKGPFTVFAPVNDAFENLPAGTVETLLKPENKSTLSKVLTYHVLSGRYDFKAISAMLKKGQSTMKTVSGNTLTFKMNGPRNIVVKDESGNTANITTYDVYQSNGVIHSIDTVLLPK